MSGIIALMDGGGIGVAEDCRSTPDALRRRRHECDVVGFVSLLVGGSQVLWFLIGQGQSWPVVVIGICLVVGSIAMLVRSRLTKKIWLLDPPTEPRYRRSWPDDH
jgi:hypothetical protein